MHKTKNGARCIPTGAKRLADGTRVDGSRKGNDVYCQAQMLPIDPQRFEWIREDNLIPLD